MNLDLILFIGSIFIAWCGYQYAREISKAQIAELAAENDELRRIIYSAQRVSR